MRQIITRKRKLFFNMILPYACVLLIPTLVWLFSNLYVTRHNEEKVISLIISNIEKSVGVVESNLNQIENMVKQISQNSAFDDFYTKKNLLYTEKMLLKSILSSYHLENGICQEIYMYSRASQIVIDKNSVYTNPADFYRYRCGYSEDMIEEWTLRTQNLDCINGYSFEKISLKGDAVKTPVFPYLRIMPMEYPSKKQGLVGVLIDEKEMLKSFDGVFSGKDTNVYVYSRNGELIMSQGEELSESLFSSESRQGYDRIKLDKKEFHKFTYTSEKNQWQYIVMVDGKEAMRDVIVVNNFLSTVSFIAFILGLLLCIYLTYGRHKSYINIIDMLGKKDEGMIFKRINHNEFEFLKPFIGNILDESDRIKKSLEKVSKSDDHKVMHFLLMSKNISEENARKLCEDYNMEFSGEKFTAMVIESSVAYNVNEINNKNMFLSQVIKKYVSEDFYLYIANSKTTVAVLNYDIDAAEFYIQLRESIARMNMDIFYRYSTDIRIGIGEAVNKLSEISVSYAQALNVIDYSRITDSKNILFHSELPSEQTMYYYSVEIEQRLMQEMSAGKTAEALKTASEIHTENFIKRNLPSNRIKELLGEILSTLDKYRQIYFEDEADTDYNKFDFTVKSFFEYLNEFILSACENAEVFNDNSQKSRFNKVIAYIKENYSDPDISLTSIAEKFGFKDITHVSKSIKKYTGDNFSSYVEKIRIEKACEMLRENAQVKEISEKTGYLSDVSLRRAFKRRMGVSPSEYAKDAQRRKNNEI